MSTNVIPASFPLLFPYGDDGVDDGEGNAVVENAGFIILPKEIGLKTRGGVGLGAEGIGIGRNSDRWTDRTVP
jgi:hypothetical protein